MLDKAEEKSWKHEAIGMSLSPSFQLLGLAASTSTSTARNSRDNSMTEHTPLLRNGSNGKVATTSTSTALPNVSTSATTTTGTLTSSNSTTALGSNPNFPIDHISDETTEDIPEFFPEILAELEKINKFFLGKLAQLRLELDEILRTRRNSYRTHHTSSDSAKLNLLRNLYIELAALRSYCELNETGFYKIIKKYDKTLNENTLDGWKTTIKTYDFTKTKEPEQLMDSISGLVSRDKLLEWERFATQQQNKNADDIFPSVRPIGVIVSLLIFGISLFAPLVNANDPAASRCLSVVLLTVSLWVTEAIPYFATALLIPILVTLLSVLKDPEHNNVLLSRDASAVFVLNHIFNHTTMLLLGGYTISSAFSRCELELRLASYLQTRLGAYPLIFILAIMFLGLFLSMWISNHTAPILCASIILPIVRDLPSDCRCVYKY